MPEKSDALQIDYYLELGRRIVANVVMLGFVAAVTDIATPDAVKRAVLDSVPKGTEELNEKAFDAGFEYGQGVEPVATAAAEAAEEPVEEPAAEKPKRRRSAKGKRST